MKKKILVTLSVIACALLLVVGSVAGTLAYLTATASVENTFTVGKVEIALAETTGSTYHLIPGQTLAKDPKVTVIANSEDCYLFVKIDNGIAGIEAADAVDTKTIATQVGNNGWTLLDGKTNVWYKAVTKAAENQSFDIFADFTVANNVANDGLATYADKKIVVTAYAIQAAGLDGAAAAWTAGGWN